MYLIIVTLDSGKENGLRSAWPSLRMSPIPKIVLVLSMSVLSHISINVNVHYQSHDMKKALDQQNVEVLCEIFRSRGMGEFLAVLAFVLLPRLKLVTLVSFGAHKRKTMLLPVNLVTTVFSFCNLGSVIAVNGGVEADVRHRVNEGCKVLGALKGIMKNRGLGMNVKKVLYEKVVVPTVMYGSESWGMKVTETQKLNVFAMKCLRSMTGVSRLDRVRKEVVRARTGVRRELAARVDVNVL